MIAPVLGVVDDLMTDETIRRVARDEGLVEGEAKGKVEGIAATAQRMLNRGVSPEQVADFTGLLYRKRNIKRILTTKITKDNKYVSSRI